MGVGAHIELRDFLLILNYPQGLSCEECIQAAYGRGYQETRESVCEGLDARGIPRMKERERIRGHMGDNYRMLEHETGLWMQEYGTKDLKAIARKVNEQDHGMVLFKEGKAVFVPGDGKSVQAWLSWGLRIMDVCGDLYRRLTFRHRRYPTYESLSRQEPEGWVNHDEMVLLFYLNKFPNKSAYEILDESGDGMITFKKWPEKFVKSLRELRAKRV